MVGIIVRVLGIIACFLFASGFAAGASKAYHEQKWGDFGTSITLTFCFWLGICIIMQMWVGV